MEAKTIAIFSNKGGVGKTFISVNLAVTLAQENKRVLLLDFDFQAGQDMSRMLNVSSKKTFVDIAGHLDKIETAEDFRAHMVTHSAGIDFLPGVANIKQIPHITNESIKLFLDKASKIYDFILVDVGKGFTEVLITVFNFANLILLVVTPDILAVYQTKWSLDILQSLHFPLKMVKMILNRAESKGGVGWQEVSSALPCEIFAHIPSDGKTVGLALNRGVPVMIDSPRSKVAEAFRTLVHDMLKEGVFVEHQELEKLRTTGEPTKPGEFWEKFGLVEPIGRERQLYPESEQTDEIIKLKKRIHDKILEKLDLKRIDISVTSDTQRSKALRQTAERIIADLLTEHTGALISSLEVRQRLIKEIADEALGLGPLEDLLADPDIADIMVNNKDEVYIERLGKVMLTSKKFISNEQVRAVIERIIAPLGRRIDESTPMVDARLPDGSRVNAIIPPLSLGGPMLTIRKFGQERYTMDDLLHRFNSLSQAMADFLQACVKSRKNTIVSGGTGSGKTTFLNILSSYIPANERIITIEDAAELKLKQAHWARLESRAPNIEGKGAVSIRDLFINCLRMRPDRIIIGECRSAEILDMLQAMNTGHDGSLTTIHANSTQDVLIRMDSMVLMSGLELPLRAINEIISSAIDVIVHTARMSDGSRKIIQITEVAGINEDHNVILKDVFLFVQKGIGEGGVVLGDFLPTGHVPTFFPEFKTRGIELSEDIFKAPPAA
jgi:pilus assembly protein CpaF